MFYSCLFPGNAPIQQFIMDKLPDSEHEITSFDAQPVLDAAVAGQTTIAVQVRNDFRNSISV